ncbi:hypothetical protein N6H18_00655 [Reichenbachiella agarivorans]|uniref:Uncharacterized protein n=1 Tax=Reichenbachiella agarivorans TaxID=2979464 RepID=A0ABY6CR16_9BACT|nr:hypothetical protein [Reichenbachiella agarivorans]UXP32485.1 hypothetical protein N6H18_00655 [Reichenbachiella agarivorans]
MKAFDINRILITSTGIFSAMVITTLMNGINRLYQEFDRARERIIPLTQKLTHFRKALYYLLNSPDIWGNEVDSSYLRRLKENFPAINHRTRLNAFEEPDSRHGIVNDPNFESRTTRLYLSIQSIVNIPFGGEISFIETIEHKYTFDELHNQHEAFNNIWYFLAHKPARVNVSFGNIGQILKEPFSKDLMHLVNSEEVESFNAKMLWDISSDFYQKDIPAILTNMQIVLQGIPRVFKFLFAELVILISFGLIMPLLSVSSAYVAALNLTPLSISTTIICYCYIIYHLSQFVFNRTSELIDEYL